MLVHLETAGAHQAAATRECRENSVLHAQYEKKAVDGAGGRPRQPRDECDGRHGLDAAEHGRRAAADVSFWSDARRDDEKRTFAQVHDLEGK